MTVCIAAICENGKRIVAAADRMFTAGAPVSLEFETEETKIEAVGGNCVALMAGNSGFGTEVLTAARHSVGGLQAPPVVDVAEALRSAYAATRDEKVTQTVIAPALGADYAKFCAKGGTLPQYLQ